MKLFTLIVDRLYAAAYDWRRFNPVLRKDGKFYDTGVRDTKVWLFEAGYDGSFKELYLFDNAYDPAIGSNDPHGEASCEWIDENKTKMVCVGGAHGQYTPMKYAIVDVEQWSVTKSGDFGSINLTYPIPVKLPNGKIRYFFRRGPDVNEYVYTDFDPSTETFSDFTSFTTGGSKSVPCILGKDFDTGRYIFGFSAQSYTDLRIVLFDPSTEKWYDPDGTELSLPIDVSGSAGYILQQIGDGYMYKKNNRYVACRPNSDQTALICEIRDISFNVVASYQITNVYADGHVAVTIVSVDPLIIVVFSSDRTKLLLIRVDIEGATHEIIDEVDLPDVAGGLGGMTLDDPLTFIGHTKLGSDPGEYVTHKPLIFKVRYETVLELVVQALR
ncbi:MAG: hypothetical protein DRH17_12650 [Deltaproteobacteria bacterium]|mgnify:CR=1 FL=1|nr:MAG: hypothetical protein DRH17_12650 [Deltaproteobacteria bacterium]